MEERRGGRKKRRGQDATRKEAQEIVLGKGEAGRNDDEAVHEKK